MSRNRTRIDRRALLGAGVGAVVGASAAALDRPTSAGAGGAVLLGESNRSNSTTTVLNANGSGALAGVASDAGAGLSGHSTAGIGVRGTTTTGGIAVLGDAPGGTAVSGSSFVGTGVAARSERGYALRTDGQVKHDKVSGRRTIPAGAHSVTFRPKVTVTSTSFALLTPMTNIGNRSLWFSTSVADNTMTIHISATRSVPTKVAWLLLG